jgi:hypothetical protein
MSGPGAVIEIAPGAEAIEARSLEAMKDCKNCPQVPFGYANAEWLAFRSQMRAGDVLLYFRNNDANWHSLTGAAGYGLARQGRLIDTFVIVVN